MIFFYENPLVGSLLHNAPQTEVTQMKSDLSKYVVCAIGAGIGTLIALEAGPMLWWTGLLAGGAIGYLFCDWKGVLRAIPAAYRAARTWKPRPRFWKKAAWASLSLCSGGLWLLLGIAMYEYANVLETRFDPPIGIALLYIGCVLIAACIGAMMIIASLANADSEFDIKEIVYILSPPMLLVYHPLRGLVWLVPNYPSWGPPIISFVRRFVWQLFLRIHSKERLLFGVDTLLGAAIGYFAGSAAVGALVGGVFSFINHKVVTERWLKPRGYLPIH